MFPKARVAVALVPFLVGLAATSPASGNFVAGGSDPAGDASDPDPGRDIVAVGLSYDRRSGHLRGGVRLRGTPSGDAPANLTLFAGRRTRSGCNGYPSIGFGTQTDLVLVDWVRLDAAGAPPGATGRAKKLYEAEAEEYEATAGALAGQRPDCVVAQLNEPGNTAVVYDVAGPFPLRALPELEVRIGRLPAAMRPSLTRTIRATVRNPGDGPTGRVRLAVARARGMTVRAPRRIPSLRAGASRTIALRVTLSGRARSSTTLRLTANAAKGVRASDDGELHLRKPQSGGGGGGGGARLCYRYSWLPPYSQLVVC